MSSGIVWWATIRKNSMRKVVLLAALLAALLAVLVAVALAAFADKGHNDGKDHHKGNPGGSDDPALSQESEQDAESGDVNQSFNSLIGATGATTPKQCGAIQGAAISATPRT